MMLIILEVAWKLCAHINEARIHHLLLCCTRKLKERKPKGSDFQSLENIFIEHQSKLHYTVRRSRNKLFNLASGGQYNVARRQTSNHFTILILFPLKAEISVKFRKEFVYSRKSLSYPCHAVSSILRTKREEEILYPHLDLENYVQN